jgi:hypothetical protein
VAKASSLLDHDTFLLDALPGKTVAVRVRVSPTGSVIAVGDTVTLVTPALLPPPPQAIKASVRAIRADSREIRFLMDSPSKKGG